MRKKEICVKFIKPTSFHARDNREFIRMNMNNQDLSQVYMCASLQLMRAGKLNKC